MNSTSPGGGGKITCKFMPIEEVAKEWMKDPEFVAAYDALEDEFAVASALIKARGEADMTQEQAAPAMGTRQAVASGDRGTERRRRSACGVALKFPAGTLCYSHDHHREAMPKVLRGCGVASHIFMSVRFSNATSRGSADVPAPRGAASMSTLRGWG